MLGEYAVRIYDQVRGRPLYLVDRTRNFEQVDRIAQAALAKPISEDDVLCEELLNESRDVLANSPVENPIRRTGAEQREVIPFAMER